MLEPRFNLPTVRRIDARLIIGSALFGAGWGLSGFCPGPAVAALATAQSGTMLFVGAMALGLWLGEQLFPGGGGSLREACP